MGGTKTTTAPFKEMRQLTWNVRPFAVDLVRASSVRPVTCRLQTATGGVSGIQLAVGFIGIERIIKDGEAFKVRPV